MRREEGGKRRKRTSCPLEGSGTMTGFLCTYKGNDRAFGVIVWPDGEEF